MLEIDGSEHSGSGTIVRDAIPFCILTGQDIHLRNIRAKRDEPGLRPQHLKALEAAADLCIGRLEGGTEKWRSCHEHIETREAIIPNLHQATPALPNSRPSSLSSRRAFPAATRARTASVTRAVSMNLAASSVLSNG